MERAHIRRLRAIFQSDDVMGMRIDPERSVNGAPPMNPRPEEASTLIARDRIDKPHREHHTNLIDADIAGPTGRRLSQSTQHRQFR